jgi:hypothetical protein
VELRSGTEVEAACNPNSRFGVASNGNFQSLVLPLCSEPNTFTISQVIGFIDCRAGTRVGEKRFYRNVL